MPGIARESSRWRWRIAMAAIAALAALWGVALATRDARGATGDGCAPACVILIQVDGLEPKDVTQQTTPFLWLLAHPTVQGQNVLGSALDRRAGFIWQAPRGVVSTGTASATASLLTGAYPQYTGVPADDFIGPSSDGPMTRQRLTAGGFGDVSGSQAPDHAAPIDQLGISSVIQEADHSAVFLGDPGLATMTSATTQGDPHWFPPGDAASATYAEQQYTGDPRLCPIPRYPDGGASIPGDQPSTDNYDPSHCPANDITTMHKAAADLDPSNHPRSADVSFAFIHLAELGAAKRLAADPDVANSTAGDTTSGTATVPQPPQPPQALADMDEAIGTFVARYAQANPAKWGKTVLMVVGSHGYATTPLVDRIPDPTDTTTGVTPIKDLSDWVSAYNNGVPAGSLSLVSQGTLATIYYDKSKDPDGTAKSKADALQSIKSDLESGLLNGTGGACANRDPAHPTCIKRVLYVDRSAAPDPGEAVPANWHLDAQDINKNGTPRTGASGELVVIPQRPWSFGRATGTVATAGAGGVPFTNPYTASSGGPEERAVAALIDGPSSGGLAFGVRNLDSFASSQVGTTQWKYYPVASHSVDPRDPNNPPQPGDPANPPACPDTANDPGGLACANDPNNVSDDAEAAGHEAQPKTVDFAMTISALMQLGFADHPEQLQGRVLQEAFLNPLARPCVGAECEPPPPPEEQPEPPPLPPPPPPEVKQPEGFNFHGLVRDLQAMVVDADGHPYRRAKRGARLSRLQIEGDFGKPESAVTLTFYRAVGASSRRARGRRTLKAIVHFDPFPVKRGHVKIKLKVPPIFHPEYIGMTVREIARGARAKSAEATPCTTVKTQKPPKFKCIGPARGIIVPIADAIHLNTQKRGSSKRGR